MDLYSLLDKNDQTQIAILRFMLDQNMTARVSEIQETLSISPFIFETNIEELMETLDHLKLGISINYDQETEWLELQKVGNADLSKLKYHYLRKSLNYQLLVYLYEHPSFSITKLASHLALGEAAVYRRISKLNKMLKEFEISIKRGQMVGSELQTCYFFFRLFWTAVPLEEIRETTNDHNSLSFVAYLEKHFGQALNSTAKIKLFLWIRILKIRLSRHDKNLLQADSIITDFPVQQKNDPLYRVICDAYFLSMGHFATFAADFKLISLYLFISSVFILSPDNIFLATAGKRPTYNDKIRELNDLVMHSVKDNYNLDIQMIHPGFIVEWKFILTQIHGIIFYFRGFINFFDDDYMYNNLLDSAVHIPDLQLAYQIVKQTEESLGYQMKESDKQLISRIHLYFLKEIQRFSKRKLLVGISYKHDYLQNHVMMQTIQAEFETKYPIFCEIAKPDTHYDLLISDSPAFTSDYDFDQLYIIHDYKTSSDTTSLKNIFKKLLMKEK